MYKIIDFVKQVYKGRTLRRIMFSWYFMEYAKNINGKVLDLGAGASNDLFDKKIELVSTDLKEKNGVMKVDLNEKLPFADGSFDTITMFFVFYILDDQEQTLKEIFRILKNNGKLYLSTPLIAPEIPEPHDYNRLTYEGLERIANNSGFENIQIDRLGGRATSAVILLHPIFVFNTVRLIFFSLALLLDKVLEKKDVKYPCPHTYVCTFIK